MGCADEPARDARADPSAAGTSVGRRSHRRGVGAARRGRALDGSSAGDPRALNASAIRPARTARIKLQRRSKLRVVRILQPSSRAGIDREWLLMDSPKKYRKPPANIVFNIDGAADRTNEAMI